MAQGFWIQFGLFIPLYLNGLLQHTVEMSSQSGRSLYDNELSSFHIPGTEAELSQPAGLPTGVCGGRAAGK